MSFFIYSDYVSKARKFPFLFHFFGHHSGALPPLARKPKVEWFFVIFFTKIGRVPQRTTQKPYASFLPFLFFSFFLSSILLIITIRLRVQ